MARKRDNIKLLSKFTLDELRAEVSRRINTEGGDSWGYVIPDDDGDDEPNNPRVVIVKVDYWKEHGHSGDQSLGDSVSLPEGFHEVQEATYEFENGDLAYAEELLKAAGFVPLGYE